MHANAPFVTYVGELTPYVAIFRSKPFQINQAQGGIHGLWADIFSVMIAAYRATPLNEDFIRRAYEYAAWCVRQPQTTNAETDLPSATAVGFLENLPLDRQVFDDLHRWLSVETFEGCKTLFGYRLTEEEYSKARSDFIRKKRSVTQAPVF